MGEMIERVEEAILSKIAEIFGAIHCNAGGQIGRAAIEAMREPTDSMADIAQEKYCGQPRETTVAWAKEDKWDAHRQDLIDEYQVFIDAALATPPAEG